MPDSGTVWGYVWVAEADTPLKSDRVYGTCTSAEDASEDALRDGVRDYLVGEMGLPEGMSRDDVVLKDFWYTVVPPVSRDSGTDTPRVV